ncbi:MAG: TPM domain-containing protein, partial [Acidobacteriota bacterium]
LVALTLSWLWLQEIQPVEGDWESGRTLVLGLVAILAIVLAGFLMGAVAATRIPALRLPFISRKEMMQEVERGASEAFHRFRVRRTAGASGVLIYVSLYEHMVRVIGDDAISEKLGQSDWDGVRDLVINGIRSGRPADGLASAIRKCGALLSEHFPVKPGDVDELHNELRIID